MYYWKTNDLANEIKNGNINKLETKNYYIAVSVITIASMYLAIGGGTTNGIATLIECILLIIVTILGINITFNTNQGNKGDDYISRVVILSLPILIKLFVITFTIGFAYGIIIAAKGEAFPVVGQWPLVIFSIGIQIVYFWRIDMHLHYINT